MSVLSYPRVYFHGHMAWDVCTANNNDYVPTYDFAHAALDWEYLATKGITPENFRDEFRKWVVKPNSDTCPPADPGDPTVDNCGPDGQRKANEKPGLVFFVMRPHVTNGVNRRNGPEGGGDGGENHPQGFQGQSQL